MRSGRSSQLSFGFVNQMPHDFSFTQDLSDSSSGLSRPMRPRRAARHPGRARSRRALRPRSMIPRGGRGHGFHVDAAFVLQ